MGSAGRLSQRWRVPEAYRLPLIHVALVLAVAAMVAAGSRSSPLRSVSGPAATTFLIAAWVCVLVAADLPFVPLVYLTTVGLLGASARGG